MAANPTFLTDTGLAGLTKNMYANFRINTFPLLTPLLSNVKRGTRGGPENMRFGGKNVIWDVVVDRPVGFTASSSGFLPVSSIAPEQPASLNICRTYVRRQVDAMALMATEAREAAYIPLAKKIVQEMTDLGRLGQQEVLHGDGTAVRGVIASVTSSTIFVVNSPYGVSGAGQGGLLLAKGMFIAVRTVGGATLRGKATILSAVNSGDNCTITVDTAIGTAAATDVIVAATASDDSYGAYPFGLVAITNRGGNYATFEGISGGSGGTYPRWDALQLTAGTNVGTAAQLTELDIWQLASQIAGRSGKDAKVKPNEFLLLTTPGLQESLASTFLGQRRFEANDMVDIKGGFKAVTISGIPLVSDFWCPAGTVYLVHLPTLTWVDLLDWVKLSYEGAGPWRWITDQDAYELSFGSYWNFGALQRNSHGSIVGYTDPTRFTYVM
jgi:hypothetical protein